MSDWERQNLTGDRAICFLDCTGAKRAVLYSFAYLIVELPVAAKSCDARCHARGDVHRTILVTRNRYVIAVFPRRFIQLIPSWSMLCGVVSAASRDDAFRPTQKSL